MSTHVSCTNHTKRPFVFEGTTMQYAPDTSVRLEHLKLVCTIDPRQKSLQSVVTQKIRLIDPNVKTLTLDQVGLAIKWVKLNQEKAKFSCLGDKLYVELPSKKQQNFELEIDYEVKNPRKGLYFIGPDSDYPSKRYQVWSQGEDQDNRYWIPTFDYPNQKATTEIIARVPKGFTAVSNGALLSQKAEGEWVEFHYKLGVPHVTYLISLVVGEFEMWSDEGPDHLPVVYYVRPGQKENGKRSFSRTPKMIEVFSKKLGVPYPYEKYAQVAVQDFVFGGMENTSATTQTERTLHDERAHLDFSSDPLVSHELAHQWFGDLVTCRDWSHAWLNEGFATFMERVWIEENIERYGSQKVEEAKYYSHLEFKDYLEDDHEKYRRSVVCNLFQDPMDIFDSHLYNKGGVILVLLRHILGDDLFWTSIENYLKSNARKNVETIDLIRAIEEVTGKNMRLFFDQWIYSAGHPEFEVKYEWITDKKQIELVIEQKQVSGKASLEKDGFVTPVFQLPIALEVEFEGGKVEKYSINLKTEKERLFFQVPSQPLKVRLDPGNFIPKEMKFPRPRELLFYQLEHDPDCTGRIEAAWELKQNWDCTVIEKLGQALLKDVFWGVQAEIAEVLSEIKSDFSREALIKGLAVANHKARRAVVKALGKFKHPQVVEALKKHAQADPSYFVEAEATYSWACSMGEDEKAKPETLEFLLSQLKKESCRDVIRCFTFKAISELPGVDAGLFLDALDVLKTWSTRGMPIEARLGSIDALAQIAKTAVRHIKRDLFEVFNQLANEDDFLVQYTLIAALAKTEAAQAIPILDKIYFLTVDSRIKREAKLVKDSLLISGSAAQSVAKLRTSLEKLEEEYKKLRDKVECSNRA
ncbi:MAG: M1 family metallopeptidase [Bdellovibrio sp.]|nr:M1 family metallopeptidase [Bdellovibrio sp.]